MADERTNELSQPTAEQKQLLKKLGKLLPDAKVHEPKANGLYYGPVLFANKHYVAQQVGENTVVAHPRHGMGALPLEGESAKALATLNGKVVNVKYTGIDADLEYADPERWNERAARVPASDHHTELARSELGPNVGVYYPPSEDKGMSPAYKGVVVGVHDNELIQRINSRTAIVHQLSDETAKSLAAGQEVTVVYDQGKLQSVEATERRKPERTQQKPDPQRSAERDPDDAARARSFNLARNVVKKNYGAEIKFYSAAKLLEAANEKVPSPDKPEPGKFVGTLVAVTDHHAVMRVSRNQFVVHNRGDLNDEQALVAPSKFVSIDYPKSGPAQVRAQERRVERQQEAPQRRQPPREQGMSR